MAVPPGFANGLFAVRLRGISDAQAKSLNRFAGSARIARNQAVGSRGRSRARGGDRQGGTRRSQGRDYARDGQGTGELDGAFDCPMTGSLYRLAVTINASSSGIHLPLGLGSRHMAAAWISRETRRGRGGRFRERGRASLRRRRARHQDHPRALAVESTSASSLRALSLRSGENLTVAGSGE